jgi:hypothetical protein
VCAYTAVRLSKAPLTEIADVLGVSRTPCTATSRPPDPRAPPRRRHRLPRCVVRRRRPSRPRWGVRGGRARRAGTSPPPGRRPCSYGPTWRCCSFTPTRTPRVRWSSVGTAAPATPAVGWSTWSAPTAATGRSSLGHSPRTAPRGRWPTRLGGGWSLLGGPPPPSLSAPRTEMTVITPHHAAAQPAHGRGTEL